MQEIIVRFFYQPQPWHYTLEDLRSMPPATIGNAIAKMLDDWNMPLAKYYEVHDVKHVLLDYGMEVEDEARMQFFLLGNPNYSLSVLLTCFICLFLMPDQYNHFITDLHRGRRAKDLDAYDYNLLVQMEVEQARRELGIIKREN